MTVATSTAGLPLKNQRRRIRNLEAIKKRTDRVCKRLHEIQIGTDPNGGEETAQDKDFAAYTALRLMGTLANSLAGWAIDHQVGLALSGKQFVPGQPQRTENHEEYLERKTEVDNHKFEIEGANFFDVSNWKNDQFPMMTGKQLRQLLRNLVYANSLGISVSVREQLIAAFEAARLGGANDFFNYPKSGHSENLPKIRRLQLKAIAHVHYRLEPGKTKLQTRGDIGEAYGVEGNTVKYWESKLRKDYGALEMDRRKVFAEIHRSNFEDAKKRNDPEDLQWYTAEFSDEALLFDGREYQDTLHSGKSQNG